jgi:hypothetical protein
MIAWPDEVHRSGSDEEGGEGAVAHGAQATARRAAA